MIRILRRGRNKSQIDLKVTTRSIAPKKVGGYSILSDEARDDVPRMDSEAKGLLAKKVALKRQNKILFGDGTSNTPVGVFDSTVAQSFNAASWTGANVSNPTLKDAIIAVANQIYTSHNYTDEAEFVPNLVVLNPADYHEYLTRKDANNNYFNMDIKLGGTQIIAGLPVIHHRDIAKGSIGMGDFTKLNIVNYIDYALKVGYINDQMLTDEFTLSAYTRFFTYVKNLDEKAFVYDTLSNIYTGIQTV